MKLTLVTVVLCLAATACATVYFSETFDDESWTDRWVYSKEKGSDAGKFKLSAGKYFNDEKQDQGIQTSTDYRFYQVSSKIDEFSNKDDTLVLQFSVKHEQSIDCGGGYIKLLPAGLDQSKFGGDSDYNIMFGPDICGPGTRRVHVILTYKGKNHLINEEIPCPYDEFTHVYTLILKSDQTFEVLVDGDSSRSGKLLEEWDFLPPKEIKDPAVSKPEDWVDEKEIDDPEDVKPEGWDDVPEYIADPDAEQPEDWDTELDGEWEPPMIENPDFKGEWAARKIPNPDYKGPWVHPLIPNPEYEEDNEIYAFDSHAFVGFEIWQVKSGTVFDNILVTNDVSVAEEWRQRSLDAQAAEKEQHAKDEEEKRKQEEEERRKREDEAAAEDDEEEVVEEEEADDEQDDGHKHGAHDEL